MLPTCKPPPQSSSVCYGLISGVKRIHLSLIQRKNTVWSSRNCSSSSSLSITHNKLPPTNIQASGCSFCWSARIDSICRYKHGFTFSGGRGHLEQTHRTCCYFSNLCVGTAVSTLCTKIMYGCIRPLRLWDCCSSVCQIRVRVLSRPQCSCVR